MHSGGPAGRQRKMDLEVNERCTEKHDEGREVSQALEFAVGVIQVLGGFLVAEEKRVQVPQSDATFYRLRSMLDHGACGPTFHLSPLLVCALVPLRVSTAEQCRVLLWHPFLPVH